MVFHHNEKNVSWLYLLRYIKRAKIKFKIHLPDDR